MFRDYLRAHSDSAAAYAALKRDLAREVTHDRLAYTDGKTELIRRVLGRNSKLTPPSRDR